MHASQQGDHFLPLAGQMDFHHTLVFLALLPIDQAQLFTSRNQGYHAMMMRLQAFGEFSDGRPFPSFGAHDMQQRKILQVCNTMIMRNLFAEAQETA